MLACKSAKSEGGRRVAGRGSAVRLRRVRRTPRELLDERGARSHAELAENLGAMVLDRADGEKEDLGDLDVRVAEGEELRNLNLPWREIPYLFRLARGRLDRGLTGSRVRSATRLGLVRRGRAEVRQPDLHLRPTAWGTLDPAPAPGDGRALAHGDESDLTGTR